MQNPGPPLKYARSSSEGAETRQLTASFSLSMATRTPPSVRSQASLAEAAPTSHARASAGTLRRCSADPFPAARCAAPPSPPRCRSAARACPPPPPRGLLATLGAALKFGCCWCCSCCCCRTPPRWPPSPRADAEGLRPTSSSACLDALLRHRCVLVGLALLHRPAPPPPRTPRPAPAPASAAAVCAG